jgi:hypothetical protein
MAKAPSKAVTAQSNSNLETIINLHTEINQLNTELKGKKAEFTEATDQLKEESKSVFDKDLGHLEDESIPEVFGNHEYHTDDHLITVNYKMKTGGLTFTQIGGRPACEYLPEMMGDAAYKKLFKETPKVVNTPEELIEAHSFRPDLVGFRMNSSALPEEVMDELREKYPDAFTPYVKDEAAYISEIPAAVVETEVSTATGFLEKVASLPEDTKYDLRDFLRKVLASCVTSAVKCGNKADA